METITISDDARASLTSDRCPSWSAPIVGTNATVLFSRRSLREIDAILCLRFIISTIYLSEFGSMAILRSILRFEYLESLAESEGQRKEVVSRESEVRN